MSLLIHPKKKDISWHKLGERQPPAGIFVDVELHNTMPGCPATLRCSKEMLTWFGVGNYNLITNKEDLWRYKP